MLHSLPFMNQKAKDSLLVQKGTQFLMRNRMRVPFMPVLAGAVAQVFSDRVGENLVVGKHSMAYPLVEIMSTPADFAVVVVAEYTVQRAPHFEAIEQGILDVLSGWDPSLRTEVHLNVIGEPIMQTSLGHAGLPSTE